MPLVLAAPILAWMAVSDFRWMRIPNLLVLALIVLFVMTAPMFLERDAILARLAMAAGVLVIGLVVFALGLFAGGDVKALAALMLFVPVGRVPIALFGFTFSAAMLIGIAAILTLRKVAGDPAVKLGESPAPGPLSLSIEQGFPMGISIALAGLAFPLVLLLIG